MPVRREGPMLVVLLSAMFLAQFDFFVVNVAAPSFRHDLHAGQTALELIVGGYAFAYATGMITGGRLGDLFGHRRIFVLGMVAFTVTSALCGAAQNPAELVAARLLQGLAGALMVPQVLALITAALPPDSRRRALGWYGVASGLGSIAGQVLGGLLLDADVFGLGWRAIFLVNVPVGLLAAPLAARLLPVGVHRAARLDLPGALGVSATLALLLVPVTLNRPIYWLCILGAVPLGIATLRRERRLTVSGSEPVLALSLFQWRSFRTGLAAAAAFMLYFASFMFILTQFLQDGLGLSPLEAGLAFTPMGVLFAGSALAGVRLVRRFGTRVVAVGAGVVAAGLLMLVAGDRTGVPLVVAALCLVGSGNGLVLPQLIGIALTDVPAQEAGAGSGMVNTTMQFAAATGVASVGTLFFAVVPTGYPEAMAAGVGLDLALILIVLALVVRAARWQTKTAAPIVEDSTKESP